MAFQTASGCIFNNRFQNFESIPFHSGIAPGRRTRMNSIFCCFNSKQAEWLAPIIMSQPVPFSTPPRPGFKVAPEPPEGKGPSIIYEDGFTKNDVPVGFYVSDLSGQDI